MSTATISGTWHPHFEHGVHDLAQRRNPRESLEKRWEGARLISERPEPPSSSDEQVTRQKQGLAVHFARREYPVRGPVVSLGQYLPAYHKQKFFLQLPAALLAMRNPRHGIYLGLVMYICGYHGAAVIDAERAEIGRLLGVGRDCVSIFNRYLVKEGFLTREYDYIDLPCVGKHGRTLRHPQKGNFYSMGPALLAIWAEHKKMIGDPPGKSYPQAQALESAENEARNQPCKPGPDPLIKPKTLDPDLRSKVSPSTVTVVGESARTPTEKAANSQRATSGPDAPRGGADPQYRPLPTILDLLDDITPDEEPELAAMLARRVLAKTREGWNAVRGPNVVGQSCRDIGAYLADEHLLELAGIRAEFSSRAQERKALSERRRHPNGRP